MKDRRLARTAACVLAAAVAIVTVACSPAGMTSSSRQPQSQPPGTSSRPSAIAPAEPAAPSHAPGAPITVLPPSTTATTPPSTSAPASTETPTTDPAPTLPPPTIVETTIPAPVRARAVVPSGTVVVIDPGHNGGNATHPQIINKQVPAGFGQYKACNTTGTATDAGYPEHRFNWQVALKLRDILQNHGITVRMTRDSDTGVGPCVNDRAAVGNDANAAAVISIHGDGEAADVTGFFVMTASRAPAGAEIASATNDLATAIRDGMVAGGFPVNSALGKNGLWARGDLGGLNLSLRPSVMIECGNMRNAGEATTMSSAAGQQRYAAAIASGVLAFLAR